MTIQISSIRQTLSDAGYRWDLSVKGLYGQGIHFTASTGLNGGGLYAIANEGEIAVSAGSYPSFDLPWMHGDPGIELVAPDRFAVHAECDATAVVDRVAAALVMLGWGPEWIGDRDAISGETSVTAWVQDYRRKTPVDALP